MKTSWFRKIIFAVALSSFATLSAQASVCFTPTPSCGILVSGGLVTSIFESIHAANRGQMNPILVAQELDKLHSVITKMRQSPYLSELITYATSSPGYQDLLARYNRGAFTGKESLQRLAEAHPELFAHLDELEYLLAEAFTPATTHQTYGYKFIENNSLNWVHYGLLAQDAVLLYEKRSDL